MFVSINNRGIKSIIKNELKSITLKTNRNMLAIDTKNDKNATNLGTNRKTSENCPSPLIPYLNSFFTYSLFLTMTPPTKLSLIYASFAFKSAITSLLFFAEDILTCSLS